MGPSSRESTQSAGTLGRPVRSGRHRTAFSPPPIPRWTDRRRIWELALGATGPQIPRGPSQGHGGGCWCVGGGGGQLPPAWQRKAHFQITRDSTVNTRCWFCRRRELGLGLGLVLVLVLVQHPGGIAQRRCYSLDVGWVPAAPTPAWGAFSRGGWGPQPQPLGLLPRGAFRYLGYLRPKAALEIGGQRSVTLFSSAAAICCRRKASCIFWAAGSSSKALMI